jgi:putative FmdB family regulatory protein
MPFYEYECSACKFYVEALQKISDPPLRKCPSCKKQTMKRLISVPVFRLKGSGWYETDFKTDQDNKRNLVESADKDAKDTSTDKKDETKTVAEPAKSETSAKPVVEKSSPAESNRTKSSSAKSNRTRATKPAVKSKPKPKAPVKKK